jgi:hypothetical protein
MSRAGISLVLGRALVDAGFLLRLEADPRNVAIEITNDLTDEDLDILANISYNELWDFKQHNNLLFGEKFH